MHRLQAWPEAALLSLLLAGCATFSTAPGARYVVVAPPGGPFVVGNGDPYPVHFNTAANVKWLRPCAYSADTAAAANVVLSAACPYAVSDTPSDEEAWMFEARPKIHGGWGRMPQDFLLIGTVEQCETTRRSAYSPGIARGWPYKTPTPPEGVPTEACKGPLRVRRDAAPPPR